MQFPLVKPMIIVCALVNHSALDPESKIFNHALLHGWNTNSNLLNVLRMAKNEFETVPPTAQGQNQNNIQQRPSMDAEAARENRSVMV